MTQKLFVFGATMMERQRSQTLELHSEDSRESNKSNWGVKCQHLIPLFLIFLTVPTTQNSPLAIGLTDVALSQPFYIGMNTEIAAKVQNLGEETLLVYAVLAEMDWVPRGSTINEPLLFTLDSHAQRAINITVHVPSDLIPTQMRYRLGLNTSLGVWFDVWRTNVVRDYWYDAYISLLSSIQHRLTDKHYLSPKANDLAEQAVEYVNDAAHKHPGTEEGYNLLLKASELIDEAEVAEADYLQHRTDLPFYTVMGLLTIMIVGGIIAVTLGRKQRKRRKVHSFVRA